MTSHVIAYRSLELLFGTHTFHFNCFLRILIAYFGKYAAYLGCCISLTCILRKVLEHIFASNLVTHLDSHQLLYDLPTWFQIEEIL